MTAISSRCRWRYIQWFCTYASWGRERPIHRFERCECSFFDDTVRLLISQEHCQWVWVVTAFHCLSAGTTNILDNYIQHPQHRREVADNMLMNGGCLITFNEHHQWLLIPLISSARGILTTACWACVLAISSSQLGPESENRCFIEASGKYESI